MVGISLLHQWNWRFFHEFGQNVFPYHWVWCLFYRLTHSPQLALWLLPAIISAALIPLTYFGARRFCGSSFSIILAGLMATGFWPIYLGRVGFPIFVVAWEIAAMFCFANFLERSQKDAGIGAAMGLGLITGLGVLTTPCWAAVGVGLVVLVVLVAARRNRWPALMVFLVTLLILFIPYFIVLWREGYGGHIQAMGFWNGQGDASSMVTRFGDYWMILWGTVNEPAIYAPPWGGFLNPIISALFFLGLIEIGIRFSKLRLVLFLAVLTLCLSTGFLSSSVETYRVLTVIPILFLRRRWV
jgi:4-amino-4-deoxy-L-arabinose transferase-like glycosyltransferase